MEAQARKAAAHYFRHSHPRDKSPRQIIIRAFTEGAMWANKQTPPPKEWRCKPKPGEWEPGALHGTHEHDECTEWGIFKLDLEAKPGSGDIIPVGDFRGMTWWNAKEVCDAHNLSSEAYD